MGKIATFVAGVIVLGASHVAGNAPEYAPFLFRYAEDMPVNWENLFVIAGDGLFYIGIALAGYAAVAGAGTVLIGMIRDWRNEEPQQPGQQNQQYDTQNPAQQGQGQPRQQQPRQRQGGQSRQPQNQQRPPRDQ